MPQPWDGRCWNRPSESRSPDSRLSSFDSWYAVARAIVAARAGRPRWTAMAVIRAAFSACSTLSFTLGAVDDADALLAGEQRPQPGLVEQTDHGPDDDPQHHHPDDRQEPTSLHLVRA